MSDARKVSLTYLTSYISRILKWKKKQCCSQSIKNLIPSYIFLTQSLKQLSHFPFLWFAVYLVVLLEKITLWHFVLLTFHTNRLAFSILFKSLKLKMVPLTLIEKSRINSPTFIDHPQYLVIFFSLFKLLLPKRPQVFWNLQSCMLRFLSQPLSLQLSDPRLNNFSNSFSLLLKAKTQFFLFSPVCKTNTFSNVIFHG